MRVPGKRQRDARRNTREDIRLVDQQQDRIVRADASQRSGQIINAAKFAMTKPIGDLIADSREPKPPAFRTKQHGVVLEQRNAHARERAAHTRYVMPPIVIAEDRPDAERRGEPRKLGRPYRIGNTLGHEPVRRDEVAQDHDEVGPQGVRGIDDVTNMRKRHVRAAGMDVGDHRDRQRVASRPCGQLRCIARNDELHAARWRRRKSPSPPRSTRPIPPLRSATDAGSRVTCGPPEAAWF